MDLSPRRSPVRKHNNPMDKIELVGTERFLEASMCLNGFAY